MSPGHKAVLITVGLSILVFLIPAVLLFAFLAVPRKFGVIFEWGPAAWARAKQRPRDWSQAWLSSFITDPKPSRRLMSGYYLAYAQALDTGNIGEAGANLDRAAALAERLRAKRPGNVLFELAYFEARHRNNVANARKYLDSAAGSYRSDYYAIPRCEAAVLLVEGRYDEASRALAEARLLLRTNKQTGDILAEYDLVADLEQRLEQQRHQNP